MGVGARGQYQGRDGGKIPCAVNCFEEINLAGVYLRDRERTDWALQEEMQKASSMGAGIWRAA
jgi:hypothetical protein